MDFLVKKITSQNPFDYLWQMLIGWMKRSY